MPARTPVVLRLLRLAWLLLAVSLRGAGTDELSLGEVHAGHLEPADSVTCWVRAREQECAVIEVEFGQSTGTARILDETGRPLRARQIDGRGQILFVAPGDGKFALQFSAERASDYTVKFRQVLRPEERINPIIDSLASARLRALQTALATGGPAALAEFWVEMGKQGTPLVEPIAGDERHLLVTFLWRGSARTRNVSVLWESFSRISPDKATLANLAGTDVWFTSVSLPKTKRFGYKLVENGPLPPRVDDPAARSKAAIRQGVAERDPLNPRQFDDTPNPGSDFYGAVSYVELPDAPPEPWIQPQPGVERGQVSSLSFRSAGLGNERTVTVYTPPGYSSTGGAYPVIFLTDGDSYLHGQFVVTALDNLIASGKVPPLVAVLVHNAPGVRVKELSCDAGFQEFLVSEIVPWARRSYHVTADPGRTIIGGLSLGGLTALYAGFHHPEIFGNVLAQSGSFWWMPPRDPSRPQQRDYEAEPSWLAAQFLASEKLPLRFYFSCGLDELDMSGRGASILVPNRHLRDVLRAKGYQVSYEEVDGAHDSLNWRYTFPRGLMALTQDFESDHSSTVR